MADWYVSSVAYAAVATFAINQAYVIGDIVKPITPTTKNRQCFRCTTAGTSGGAESAWSMNNNATTAQGTATFTCVTGQSTYGWAAAAGDDGTLNGFGTGTNRIATGDRIFASSDHAQSDSGTTVIGNTSSGYGVVQRISVNRAGSVPPVGADYLAGASITTTAGAAITLESPMVMDGYTLTAAGALNISNNNTKTVLLRNCTIAATGLIESIWFTRLLLENCNVTASNGFQEASAVYDVVWLGGTLTGTAPTSLFTMSTMTGMCRGVDLSAAGAGKALLALAGSASTRILLDSCKIAAAVSRTSGSWPCADGRLELVNCYDGTNIISEAYAPAGQITTERTIVLTGGSSDVTGAFSHKMVSSTNIDKYCTTLDGFPLHTFNSVTGSSQTATVEIISSGSLNNDDISLFLEFEGTVGSSIKSLSNSLPTNILTTPAAVTTSTASWASSPATPVKQKLQVAFTAQDVGWVRGTVKVGKASTTVYHNCQMTIA